MEALQTRRKRTRRTPWPRANSGIALLRAAAAPNTRFTVESRRVRTRAQHDYSKYLHSYEGRHHDETVASQPVYPCTRLEEIKHAALSTISNIFFANRYSGCRAAYWSAQAACLVRAHPPAPSQPRTFRGRYPLQLTRTRRCQLCRRDSFFSRLFSRPHVHGQPRVASWGRTSSPKGGMPMSCRLSASGIAVPEA